MCTSESDTQSPAELRVQYPTMPQLLPQPAAAAAKNSVLCARRALCFLARFAWRGADAGASSARAEGSKRWSERIEPVACYSSSASQLKSVSYLESPCEQRTNEKTRQIAAVVFTFISRIFFLSNRCGSALVTHILTRLLINKRNKSEFA